MRGTLHVALRNSARIYHYATKRYRLKVCDYLRRRHDLSVYELESTKDQVMEMLFRDPAASRCLELALCQPSDSGDRRRVTAVRLAIRTLWEQGLICTTYLGSTWNREVRKYMPSGTFAKPSENHDIHEADAARELILNYFQSYGPATIEDAAWWSGLGITIIRDAVREARSDLVNVQIKGSNDEHYMTPAALDALAAKVDDNFMSVRLLPQEDNLLKGFSPRNRLRFFDPIMAEHILNKAGETNPLVLYDRRIVGTWSVDVSSKSPLTYRIIDKKRHMPREQLKNECQRIISAINEAQALGDQWVAK